MAAIVIDRAACSGYGACIDVAPEVFMLADDGIVVALVSDADGLRLAEAVRSCPMGALRIEDSVGAAR